MTAFGPGRWTQALVQQGATQPITRPVASDDVFYLRSKGRLRIAWRTLRRLRELQASGQQPLLRDRLDPAWKRALWIHAEAPQIGDALMDLAPRSLLVDRGIEVDLLAAPAIAALFSGDRWLRRSASDALALALETRDAPPDFVIATSHSAESLAAKRQHWPALPWVSLKGLYQGYDYHRAGFATQRLADLGGFALTPAEVARHARQKLELRPPAHSPVRSPLPSPSPSPLTAAAGMPALALGGVRQERIYDHWPEVAAALHAGGVPALLLVGSANGRAAADRLVASAPAGLAVHDAVDRLDLHETQAVLAAASVLVCADGGLMHLGLTTPTPLVALFNAAVDPAWRLPPDFDGSVLRSTGDVSAIDAARVASATLAMLDRRRR